MLFMPQLDQPCRFQVLNVFAQFILKKKILSRVDNFREKHENLLANRYL
jgi:hypothetical protein